MIKRKFKPLRREFKDSGVPIKAAILCVNFFAFVKDDPARKDAQKYNVERSRTPHKTAKPREFSF